MIDYYINEYPTYIDTWNGIAPPQNTTPFSVGARLMPRSIAKSDVLVSEFTDTVRFINENGGVFSGVSVNASKKAGSVSNAVLPAWRDAMFSAVVGT